MLFCRRADDVDLISSAGQGDGLLPDAAIERDGQLLDKDQHMSPITCTGFRSLAPHVTTPPVWSGSRRHTRGLNVTI